MTQARERYEQRRLAVAEARYEQVKAELRNKASAASNASIGSRRSRSSRGHVSVRSDPLASPSDAAVTLEGIYSRFQVVDAEEQVIQPISDNPVDLLLV